MLEETPTLLACRWHLGRTLQERLRASGVVPPRNAGAWGRSIPTRKRTGMSKVTGPRQRELRVRANEPSFYDETRIALSSYENADQHPLVVAGRRALGSVEAWDALLAEAHRWQANQLATWMNKNSWIRDDLAARSPRLPKTIGGLEAQLKIVRDSLIGDRAVVLRNAVRTQRLLDLMTLHLRSDDNVTAYTARIRAHLAKTGTGRPDLQRVGVTGGPRLHT